MRGRQKVLQRRQKWKREVQGAGSLTEAKGGRCFPQVSVKCYRGADKDLEKVGDFVRTSIF